MSLLASPEPFARVSLRASFRGIVGVGLAIALAGPAAAQATAPTPVGPQPPVTPGRAFLMSLVAPGLAQSKMQRGTGILFVTVEAVSLTMYAKSRRDLDVAKGFANDSTPLSYSVDPNTGTPMRDSTGALVVAEWATTRYGQGRIQARKTHVEDWIALLIFNHLVAAADAFVAAQLWDLPARVSIERAQSGARVSANIRW